MASVFTLKRKTFGKKFNEYIKKNNLKVEDAEEIVEKGAKKLNLVNLVRLQLELL